MNNIFTKRTVAAVLAVVCAAGAVPVSAVTNGFSGITALTAYAEQGTSAKVHEAATLEEFLAAANSAEDGDTIKLTDSFDITGIHTIDNGKSFTVDFNDNIIWFDSMGNRDPKTYFYINNEDTHITFLDSGNYGGMFAENPDVIRFVIVKRGTVEFLSGRYTGGHDISRTESNDAHIYIKGGYYDLQKDDNDGPFYRSGSGHYYLTGGYFTQRTNLMEKISKLDEGYEYYDIDEYNFTYGIRKVNAISIDETDIENVPDQEYTGDRVKPKLNITFGTRGMKENEDYTVSIEKNTEVGTAFVYINGIGDFYGTTSIKFYIKKMPEYTIPKDLKVPFGSKVADVTLPAADNGTWRWENADTNVGSAGKNTFKAVFVPNDTDKYLTVEGIEVPVTVYHTYKKVSAVEATCNTAGNIEYYICSDGKYYTDNKGEHEIVLKDTVIPSKGHTINGPVWNWNKYHTTATLSFSCSECNRVYGTTAQISTTTEMPTYTTPGKEIYQAEAKYNGKIYTDTQEVIIPKLTYIAPVISYEKGYGAVKLSWTDVDDAEEYAVAAYISGKWTVLDKGVGNSYVLTGLKEGKEYKVAVFTKAYGEWIKNYTNAVVVTPKETTTKYPAVTNIEYSEDYHQFRLSWTKVKDAQNYGVAVYIAGRWQIVAQDIPATVNTFTSPKLKEGQTYKMVVCAKIGGKWDTSALNTRTFNVTVK